MGWIGGVKLKFWNWAKSRPLPFTIDDVMSSGLIGSHGYSSILIQLGKDEGWLEEVPHTKPKQYLYIGKR